MEAIFSALGSCWPVALTVLGLAGYGGYLVVVKVVNALKPKERR